jgi:hypothetical protein
MSKIKLEIEPAASENLVNFPLYIQAEHNPARNGKYLLARHPWSMRCLPVETLEDGSVYVLMKTTEKPVLLCDVSWLTYQLFVPRKFGMKPPELVWADYLVAGEQR